MSATTSQAVLHAAKTLFARKGFDGTSVRDICREAGVSANAVHYHFGSKGTLYRAILDRFMQERLASAERMLSAQPEDLAELRLRLILFCEETMVSLLDDPETLRIAFDEMLGGFAHGGEGVAEAIRDHEQRLTDFLTSAQSGGLLREDVDAAILAGTLLERLLNQVRYVEVHVELWNTTPLEPSYRRHWIEQMVDLCVYGAAIGDDSSRHVWASESKQ